MICFEPRDENKRAITLDEVVSREAFKAVECICVESYDKNNSIEVQTLILASGCNPQTLVSTTPFMAIRATRSRLLRMRRQIGSIMELVVLLRLWLENKSLDSR